MDEIREVIREEIESCISTGMILDALREAVRNFDFSEIVEEAVETCVEETLHDFLETIIEEEASNVVRDTLSDILDGI